MYLHGLQHGFYAAFLLAMFYDLHKTKQRIRTG